MQAVHSGERRASKRRAGANPKKASEPVHEAEPEDGPISPGFSGFGKGKLPGRLDKMGTPGLRELAEASVERKPKLAWVYSDLDLGTSVGERREDLTESIMYVANERWYKRNDTNNWVTGRSDRAKERSFTRPRSGGGEPSVEPRLGGRGSRSSSGIEGKPSVEPSSGSKGSHRSSGIGGKPSSNSDEPSSNRVEQLAAESSPGRSTQDKHRREYDDDGGGGGDSHDRSTREERRREYDDDSEERRREYDDDGGGGGDSPDRSTRDERRREDSPDRRRRRDDSPDRSTRDGHRRREDSPARRRRRDDSPDRSTREERRREDSPARRRRRDDSPDRSTHDGHRRREDSPERNRHSRHSRHDHGRDRDRNRRRKCSHSSSSSGRAPNSFQLLRTNHARITSHLAGNPTREALEAYKTLRDDLFSRRVGL